MTVYFITGVNRGIGYQLARLLSANSENLVIGSVRDLSKADDVKKLNVKLVTLDLSDFSTFEKLPEQLSQYTDVIDVFVSNAGISDSYSPIHETKEDVFFTHYRVNAVAPLLLVNSIKKLTDKSSQKYLFFISSIAGSITGTIFPSIGAYGQSKAALNYGVKMLEAELGPEGYVPIAFHPGMVTTDMGLYGLLKMDDESRTVLQSFAITPEKSGESLTELFGKITKEDSGKFYSFDGSEVPY